MWSYSGVHKKQNGRSQCKQSASTWHGNPDLIHCLTGISAAQTFWEVCSLFCLVLPLLSFRCVRPRLLLSSLDLLLGPGGKLADAEPVVVVCGGARRRLIVRRVWVEQLVDRGRVGRELLVGDVGARRLVCRVCRRHLVDARYHGRSHLGREAPNENATVA
jgi:hypothetical protein